MYEHEDCVYIFANDHLVLLSHRDNSQVIKLILTDLKENCRSGDKYQGQILCKEATRAWIDIGESKPALIKKLPESFKEGEFITVKVDRAMTSAFQGKKGAQVSYCQSSLVIDHKNKKIKIYSHPPEWVAYLKNVSHETPILTNSSDIFLILKKEFPSFTVILKSETKIPQDVHFAWENLLNKEVEIPGGGFIVIEETEALTSIDVNTGGLYESSGVYIKQEQDGLKFNLKAACLVQDQIQQRDLAGILVIDFPFIKKNEIQKQIFNLFHHKKDNRQQILGFTKAGLFEITRQKTNESLSCKYQDLRKNRPHDFPC